MWITSFLWILVGFAIYGFLHSWLASNALKQWIYQTFPGLERYYRLIYSVFGVISLLPILYITYTLPAIRVYQITPPWLYLTLGTQVVVIFILAVGVRQTDNMEFLGIKQALSGSDGLDSLVVTGLYRYMRHPIYSLGLVLMWLFPRMNSNLLALFIAFTLYIFIGAILEERKLALKYPEYQEYQKKVPMFLPKFR